MYHNRLLPLLVLAATVSGELSLCKRHVYLARAEQEDNQGRKCWDNVKVPTCGGRCDSREVSDWRFPFKKAHHPVCVHGSRRPLVVKLRHCEPGATAGTELFHYIAAEDCRCMLEDIHCWIQASPKGQHSTLVNHLHPRLPTVLTK